MEVGGKALDQMDVALVPGYLAPRKGEAAPSGPERRQVSHRDPLLKAKIPGAVDERLLLFSGNRPIGLGPDLGPVFPEVFLEHGVDTMEAPFQVKGKPGAGESTVDDTFGIEDREISWIDGGVTGQDSRRRNKIGHLPKEVFHFQSAPDGEAPVGDFRKGYEVGFRE